MIIVGILLSVVGLGAFCWALFALAMHALPFFVGITAGIYIYQTGAGPLGAIVAGFLGGGLTLVLGQYAFSAARSPIVRLLIRMLFAVPAARAGYDVSCTLRYSPGMVAGVVRHAWRHRRREHRLGARVDLDRDRSQTGRCIRPSPAAGWGDDQGQVTLRSIVSQAGSTPMPARLT